MNITSPQRSPEARATLLALCSLVLVAACAVQDIDALIAERGVTDCPSSTGDSSEGSSDTSTSTSTGASVGGTSSSESTTSGGETSDTSTGSESSTGPSEPVCGDGVVEGDETCDDGNVTPGDGCQECARDSIVFITSEVYQGFALGGLYGADLRCQSLAAKAGLQRFLTFKAWLSTPSMSVADRFLHSRGRYVLVNGLVVAQDWDALTSGTIETTITVDEKSQTQDTRAWTGTLASGLPALGSEFCEDWDDDSGLLKFGGTGLSVNTDAAWSFFEQGPCGSELRLYCVQQ
ncbi:MAG: DUF4215 domain-containing protein [Nannocystis sp.]|uniref:DUF4215 domain-containing protein n=1 Tax=Nannocystis sp. TaxID=1962667 RepID=UPI0024252584|nr:DUF4215 domain-containing protein [Nannocystis sp.]MBK9756754.1 DUF4215 domain-containing protein [Nannocystis sp.]